MSPGGEAGRWVEGVGPDESPCNPHLAQHLLKAQAKVKGFLFIYGMFVLNVCVCVFVWCMRVCVCRCCECLKSPESV